MRIKNGCLLVNFFMVLLFSFSFLENCVSQIYISPYVGLGLSKTTNSDVRYFSKIELNNNFNISYSIGIGFEHFLSENFSLGLTLQGERLDFEVSRGSFLDGQVIGAGPIPSSTKYYHDRIYTGLNFKFSVAKNISFSSGMNHVYTPYVYNFSYTGSDKEKFPTKKSEFGVNFSLHFFYKAFNLTAFYYHSLWYDGVGYYAELDPIKTIGLRLGYRIKVLDEFKSKRSKVNCPKL